MTQLSVNVNKLATLRNSRGKNIPDVLKMTLDVIKYGAQGITVHPRPDERHIKKADVYQIAEAISVELNIEGYPDNDFVALIKRVKPAQCTLVPDAPNVLTSNAGWDIKSHHLFLKNIIKELQATGARTSLFVDPYNLNSEAIDLLIDINPDRVELYTEAYADAFHTSECASVLQQYATIAHEIHQNGIGLNAGHDLNTENLATFIKKIPTIQEVSIGHALICDALYDGLETTIQRYLYCLR